MPSPWVGLAILGITAATLSVPALALDEIVDERGWTQVDFAESGECRAEVRGNGQFYVPFLWHREGGTVRVDLQSATCTLSLSFGWERRRP